MQGTEDSGGNDGRCGGMNEYYRELIGQTIQKIDDEMKLHEIYVMALMAVPSEENAHE